MKKVARAQKWFGIMLAKACFGNGHITKESSLNQWPERKRQYTSRIWATLDNDLPKRTKYVQICQDLSSSSAQQYLNGCAVLLAHLLKPVEVLSRNKSRWFSKSQVPLIFQVTSSFWIGFLHQHCGNMFLFNELATTCVVVAKAQPVTSLPSGCEKFHFLWCFFAGWW